MNTVAIEANTNPRAAWRQRLSAWLDSTPVAVTIIGLIVINAIILGIEATPGPFEPWLPLLIQIDHALLVVFTIEILLKLVARGWSFFREPWSVFDFIVVGIALVPTSEAFSVLRALRILRALRLISMVPSMRKVVSALLGALPGMGSIVALLVLVIYVAAVMATKLLHDAAPEFFGTLGASLFTLFQIMTVEGWPDIAREVMKTEPMGWIFFVVYLVTATFTVLNLFIAVIVNAMQENFEEEKQVIMDAERIELAAHSQVLSEVRALRQELAELRGKLHPA